MVIDTSKLAANWKTTASGALTASLTTSAAFLAPPLNVLVSAKVILWLGAFQILGKLWISLIQKDAGTTEAVVPGSTTPQAVPSHEVPDDPKAIPVSPKGVSQ